MVSKPIKSGNKKLTISVSDEVYQLIESKADGPRSRGKIVSEAIKEKYCKDALQIQATENSFEASNINGDPEKLKQAAEAAEKWLNTKEEAGVV